MNVYGGEDRFWLGPEGGQFSLFFAPGAPQDLAHWQTPAPIDAEPFTLVGPGAGPRAAPQDDAPDQRVGDGVRSRGRARGADPPGPLDLGRSERRAERCASPSVGFETRNRVTNRGADPWRRETGLISIWIAGTFAPSPSTTIVLPRLLPPDGDLGPGAGGERSLLRPRGPPSAAGQGARRLLPRRRPAPRQDRRPAPVRAARARQLRRRRRRAHGRHLHAPHGPRATTSTRSGSSNPTPTPATR